MEVVETKNVNFNKIKIPDNWELRPLSEICNLVKAKINPQQASNNYRCIELEHLEPITGKLLGVTYSKSLLSNKTIFLEGDVLYGKLRPYLRKYYYADFTGVCSSEIWVLRSNDKCYDKYLYYLIQSRKINEAANASTGTRMPRADWSIVSEVELGIPINLQEQKAIATALSDVDALIQKLDALIQKKQDIKKATMQLLLTGNKRLDGFEGEWEEKALGDMLTVMHGKSQKGIESESGKYPILATSGEIGRANTYLYNKPSVLIGRKGTINKPQYTESPFWTIDTLFYTVMKENIDTKYVYFLFQLIDWMAYNEASGVPSLNSSTIESINIHLPATKKEQISIREIIDDMDFEIERLNTLRTKYGKIKQGMMQELLTGKTRLV